MIRCTAPHYASRGVEARTKPVIPILATHRLTTTYTHMRGTFSFTTSSRPLEASESSNASLAAS